MDPGKELMAGHRPTTSQDNLGRWYGRCNCGWNSGVNRFGVRQLAEDSVVSHQQQVARALANLHRGKGSLRSERDHARRMLDDPNVSAADKRVWQIVFDGAAQRLGSEPTQDGLWEA